MLKIAIFDDERIIVDYVEKIIKNYLKENIKIYKYTKITEIEKDYKKGIFQEIDIIYIDIKINQTNGIEVAEKMQAENPNLEVIYMTAFSQYSEEIFRTKPTYLLLKPIKKENLEKSLKKAIKEKGKKENVKSFFVKGKIFNIRINEIRYIESNKRIITIHEQDINRNIYTKLNDIAKKLPKHFVRCHQSYIVNLEKVRELNSHEVILHSGEVIPVSQAKYKQTKEMFIKYLGEGI